MAEKKQADAAENGSMRVDTALVKELAELLTENDLNEIEVEDGDRKIKVRRDHPPLIAAAAAPSVAAATPAPASVPAAAPAPAAPAEEEVAGQTVKSPMVGTVYLSAEPGAKPFALLGQAVKAGDTLVIVEAMKVMNPITAPAGGVVKKIFVSDGQGVEFDQPLVIIG